MTKRSSSQRSVPAPAADPLAEIKVRIAAAVVALEAAERAGDATLYRADELLIRIRRLTARTRRVLADADAREVETSS